MIDHVIVNVKDLALSKRFYREILTPLGYAVVWDMEKWVGFGKAGKADFWIALRNPRHTKVHIAFRCDEKELVDRFHAAGLQAGGKDNGPPAIHEDYGPNYYAAFIFDPDGNNIEAVCQKAS